MSPVIAIDECPNRSATALMCTPDSSHATAAEWRSVCTTMPSSPAFLAASSIVRRMLRGSTGVPPDGNYKWRIEIPWAAK
jgi:hypothetical protein